MKTQKAASRWSIQGLILFVVIALTGCESVPPSTPYPAYDTNAHPLSDTAIFQAWDGRREIGPRIEGVDGKAYGCASYHSFGNHACPLWVRVAPGAHTFLIHVFFDLHGNTYARYADISVTVPDMRATHTYLLEVDPTDGKPPIVHDLGANAKRPLALCESASLCPPVVPTFE